MECTLLYCRERITIHFPYRVANTIYCEPLSSAWEMCLPYAIARAVYGLLANEGNVALHSIRYIANSHFFAAVIEETESKARD